MTDIFRCKKCGLFQSENNSNSNSNSYTCKRCHTEDSLIEIDTNGTLAVIANKISKLVKIMSEKEEEDKK